MKIISRNDEIINIFIRYLPEEIIKIILKKERYTIMKETVRYHLSNSPIYCRTWPNDYFFTLKKHRHVLYDQDYPLMNQIRLINGSLKKVREQIRERIWGKYLSSLRF